MSSKYVSNDERDEVFRILRQNKVNNMCVECGSPNPQWASSTLGIFICYQCSGLHRSFGVHLTFVRSLNMDLWTPKQIEVMKVNPFFIIITQPHCFPSFSLYLYSSFLFTLFTLMSDNNNNIIFYYIC